MLVKLENMIIKKVVANHMTSGATGVNNGVQDRPEAALDVPETRVAM
jgi:hypothetical protein